MHLKKITIRNNRFPEKNIYPYNLDLLKQTKSIEFTSPVTFFVGRNGSGKSTLLRAICKKCGIQIWQEVERTRYNYNIFEDTLFRFIDLEWDSHSVPGSYFASQIFQDFSRFLDEWAKADPGILDYFGGGSLMTKSHGESLLAFFEARYKIKGIYLMDEPETALSPESQIRLLKLLKKMSDAGHAQFIIASHSPILLAYPGATIYSFDHVPVSPISYEETEYYKIYRDFLLNREKFISDL
jgi:predicted ATPase